MKVKLADIVTAIEMTDETTEYFLDKETGEIVYVDAYAMGLKEREEIYDRMEEHDSYCLPDRYEIDNYRIMEDFIDTLSGTAHDKLLSAIQGKGAFRRFKDAVYDLGISKLWFKYQADAYKRKAIRWCEDNDIEYEE